MSQTAPPKSEAEEFATLCMRQVIEEWKKCPEHLKSDFLSAISTIGISMMNKTIGVEFTRGFLDEARASLRDPDKLIFRAPKGH